MEDIALLKKIEFLNELELNKLLQVNKIAENKKFKTGEVIVKKGEVCNAFYIVKSGAVQIDVDGRIIAELGEGEPIGEISFIDKDTGSATVIARENTVLIKLRAESFDALLSKDNDMASHVYRKLALILCRRLRETNEVLILLR